MPARTGCCTTRTNYTTRAYDLSGNTLWSADYFDTATGVSTGHTTTCQAIDSTQVYVGGTRETNGSIYWSLRAFNISTGALVWSRDLLTDVTGTGASYDVGTVREICIDTSGNVVCLMKARTGYTLQAFVVITTAGALSAVRTFTPPGSGLRQAASFCINQNGDYHWVDNARSVHEWLSPFAGAFASNFIGDQSYLPDTGYYLADERPLTSLPFASVIKRIGGRDYIGFTTDGIYPQGQNLVIRGVVQAAAPHAVADFDLTIQHPNSRVGPFLTTFPIITVSDIAVDSAGRIYGAGQTWAVTPGSTSFILDNTVRQWNSSGVLQWTVLCGGQSVDVDSSDNVYSSADLTGTATPCATISKRNSSGTYSWGNLHAAGDYALDYVGRQINISTTSVIKTGNNQSVLWGPATTSTDSSFVSDTCPPGTIGTTCTGACTYTATNPQVATTTANANGTYTPSDQGSLTVQLWGGGGGGGGGAFLLLSIPGGDGGGGGGYSESAPTAVMTSNTYTHTLGAGGGVGGVSGDPDDSGRDGSDATVTGPGISLSATGGEGGAGADTPDTGAGGIGTGGPVNGTGTAGTIHASTSGGAGGGAAGAGGGGGGGGGLFGNPGVAGTTPGGGGGGGGKQANGASGGDSQVTYLFTKWDWTVSDTCAGTCSACAAVDATFYAEFGRPVSGSSTITIPCG